MPEKNGKIYQLLPMVAKDIGAIAKTRQGQGYKFRGIDDVLNAIHTPMCEHGVFVTTEVRDVSREERETKSGGSITYTRLLMQVTFWASDGSSVSTLTAGEAMDVSDKSTNKAMSAAMKYAMFQTFTIPLEEPEVEDDQHETRPRPAVPAPPPPAVSRDFEQLRKALYDMGVPQGKLDHANAVVSFCVAGATIQQCAKDAELARRVMDELTAKAAVSGSEPVLREALEAAGLAVVA